MPVFRLYNNHCEFHNQTKIQIVIVYRNNGFKHRFVKNKMLNYTFN